MVQLQPRDDLFNDHINSLFMVVCGSLLLKLLNVIPCKPSAKDEWSDYYDGSGETFYCMSAFVYLNRNSQIKI